MAAGQRRAGEVVKAPGARLAAIPLPIGLSLVAPVPDHRVTAATGAAHALRPAALAHQGEALGVVHQTREVDQVGCSHGGEDSVHERGLLSPLAPAHQASFAPRPGPNLTTPKPDKSVINNGQIRVQGGGNRSTLAVLETNLTGNGSIFLDGGTS